MLTKTEVCVNNDKDTYLFIYNPSLRDSIVTMTVFITEIATEAIINPWC